MKQPFDLRADPHYHVGRPEARPSAAGGVMIVCPRGHVIAFVKKRDWAGSSWQARAKDPRCTVECTGTRGV